MSIDNGQLTIIPDIQGVWRSKTWIMRLKKKVFGLLSVLFGCAHIFVRIRKSIFFRMAAFAERNELPDRYRILLDPFGLQGT